MANPPTPPIFSGQVWSGSHSPRGNVPASLDERLHELDFELQHPIAGCQHLVPCDDGVACLCCAGTIRCHACHRNHLQLVVRCPLCGANRVDPTVVVIRRSIHVQRLRQVRDGGRWPIATRLRIHGHVCGACSRPRDADDP